MINASNLCVSYPEPDTAPVHDGGGGRQAAHGTGTLVLVGNAGCYV